ncbi:MAG: zinc ribbon domain-containing protein [Candidatus Dadabacteria bacterium]|nr:zinc ribbon domain-containing protein [Candidatus Dadabacteria bacterium]NIS08341.1 zinc ribbon domain-containing protein [Candidatus Dadabacteria bacterium]NIV43119.1 zinc ribbon domain-containing protein [Candidatus Dadabacteria bacterium]NIX14733.1 zinc ribbon domain-containing protein [Candidatus Dadabacteria bacterium]NIY22250.1 zinc ribbon domain-containing protein [Candidatus Dadabacteria bacterium]
MPIYEYECKKCGDVIEAIQGFSDAPLRKHKECGGKLERMISLSSFHLKGSGWYDTEYGKKKVKRGTQSAEKGDKAGGDDSKADSKESSGSSTAASSDTSSSTADSIKKDTAKAKNASK